jgi:transposase
MEQPVSAPASPASFGAFLRTRRHRACFSQEQLAARAELSERTVRNLEADRVQAPRADTMRLLAEALQLSEPERASWFEAARGGPPQIAVRVWASQPGRDAGTCDGGGLTTADGRELAELRRENHRLREDVEILKRTAAILAAAAPRPLWAGHENQPYAREEQDAHLPERLFGVTGLSPGRTPAGRQSGAYMNSIPRHDASGPSSGYGGTYERPPQDAIWTSRSARSPPGVGPRSKTLRQRRSLEPVLVRVPGIGPRYRDRPRAGNRPGLHQLAASGQPPGLLASDGDIAVGWCELAREPSWVAGAHPVPPASG